ncbi:polymer-forming cytoskeletal protein [Methanomicrobium antiquum]|uniref:Polymer-forming cytoskeletal protein n=1 Tax=Methanomicrobium antiquum TaxID=487686 RepID=A0AAF0JLG9_9EURY|nr:polymer-forming cytoskeletal protein [Methanomicrobium antiquum]WFN36102.1 polymer-forming cytoskeletal protein [Methanomicrobium antiquum]
MEKGAKDWLWQCTIPEGTELQEHTLKTKRSIIIGDKCRIDYGLVGDEILISEFCQINGNISTENDLRIDNWSEVTGDVISQGDAFIGEGVRIKGRVKILGDLDLGDNVIIDSGFEAKGWISIRNPLPVITYIMLYLITLLGLEKEEDINSFFQKLFSEDEEEEKGLPLIIPPNSTLNMEVFSVQSPMKIGPKCRFHGNIRANSAVIESENVIFGSISSEKDIKISKGTVIHGAVSSVLGDIEIESGVHILGDVKCHSLSLDEEAVIDGTIKAPGGVKILRKK